MGSHSLQPVVQHLRDILARQSAEALSDRQLLERFARGREEASFAALVERHGSMVLGVCRRVLGDHHAAEDAYQATFLVLARKAASVPWRDSVGSWLHAVACRVALRARAQAHRVRALEAQAARDEACLDDPAADALRQEVRRVLDEELARLPGNYRAVLLLCDLEGRTHQEAARELGWPAGSLSRHLARARELLRERLAWRGLTLSLAMLSGVLSERPATAAVESTVRAALLFTAGRAATGAACGPAVPLAQGVLQAMLWTQGKAVAAAVCLVGLLGIGTSHALRGEADAGRPAPAPRPSTAAALPEAPTTRAVDGAPAPTPSAARATTSQEIRERLAERVDMPKGIDPNTPLRDALEHLSDKYGVTFLVNEPAFAIKQAVPEVGAQPVKLPRLTGIPLETVLKAILQQVDGTYVIRPTHIEITTGERTRPEDWQYIDRTRVPVVSKHFEQRPLVEALQELAEMTGISVILDRRAADKVQALNVTATLNNVPLDTAVQLLADMNELKAVAIDNVLYVTSPENAERLQTEQKKRRRLREAEGAL